MNLSTLIAIGGIESKTKDAGSGGATRHRVYFNDLRTWFGLVVTPYNNGPGIRGATLNGLVISGLKARNLAVSLDSGKVWFDVALGKYFFNIPGCRQCTGSQIGNAIVTAIRKRVTEHEQARLLKVTNEG